MSRDMSGRLQVPPLRFASVGMTACYFQLRCQLKRNKRPFDSAPHGGAALRVTRERSRESKVLRQKLRHELRSPGQARSPVPTKAVRRRRAEWRMAIYSAYHRLDMAT